MEKECKICKKKFYTDSKKKTTCSKECSNKARGINKWKNTDFEKEYSFLREKIKVLKEKGFNFSKSAKELNFNNNDFRTIVNELDFNVWEKQIDNKKVERICEICNKKFVVNKFNRSLYCSKECSNKAKGLNTWNKVDYEKEYGYLRPILKEYNQKMFTVLETANALNIKYMTLRSIMKHLDCNYWTATYENHVRIKRLKRNNYKSGTKKAMETVKKKYGVNNPFQIEEVRIRALLSQNNTISKPNIEFAEKLGIEYKKELVGKVFEKKVRKYSYDLFYKNILLEINPTITHNTLISINKNWKVKEKDYHQLKSLNAKEHGYRCIHIFDWDDLEKISYLLNDKEKIMARKCEVKEIDSKTAKEFINKYHLQNYVASKIKIGLFYKNELVEVMTFGKPRYNSNFEWELLRLCSHKDFFILGGASKIFSYFIKKYNPKSIISYCDISKFDGNIYEKLGFKENNSSGPSKHWYKVLDSEIILPKIPQSHITDNMLRMHGWSRIVGDYNYELAQKGDSNEELMIKSGYLPIYDCGQSRYEWFDKVFTF